MSSGWERVAAHMARSLERRVDALGRGGSAAARQVVPYRGFGTASELFLTGRVLANPEPAPVAARDRWWRNLANTLRHMESAEVAGARVRLRVGGGERDTMTDEEGFYRAWLSPAAPLGDTLWHDVDALVLDRLHPDAGEVRRSGLALVPIPQAEYGVISDLDDTVIRTDATRLFRMLRRTLLENARTRLPFEGVAQFYNGLHAGSTGVALNPIFYVSSSPWNLYSVLTDFLEHHGIPLGPLTLRDWGISESGLLTRGHGEHKLSAICQIMDVYPALPFILIGDSGQEDPEIYRDVVHQYGNRIRAIYIRSVTTDPTRARAIGELAEEVRGAGSELLLSEDTLASVKHAAEREWIPPQTVRAVEETVSSASARPD
ncbi:MAG TPA: phosphatase domain-containing protein [Longimicrobiales bacterium]|nr:phosphatase domain-containing protein [Longimicrobiales bacterium]